MDVQKYIRELLMQHDCVVVPGLGGFITMYKPALQDVSGKRILPPSRSVSFNRQLSKNDGILISHIAAKAGIPYKLAGEKVELYTGACKRQLANRGIIVLPDIGKLYTDADGSLNFSPATGRNYLADAFGLTPVSWYKIYREQTPAEHSQSKEPLKTKTQSEVTFVKRKTRYRATIATSFAATIILVILIAQGIYIQPLQLKSLSLFNIDNSAPAYTLPAPVAHAPLAAPNAGGHPEPILMPEAGIMHIHETSMNEGYYLVLASLETKAKAESYLERQQLTNELIIMNDGNNHFRVATFVTKNSAQAYASLSHFRQNYRPDVWLLYNRY